MLSRSKCACVLFRPAHPGGTRKASVCSRPCSETWPRDREDEVVGTQDQDANFPILRH
jgi:hypothetical protein